MNIKYKYKCPVHICSFLYVLYIAIASKAGRSQNNCSGHSMGRKVMGVLMLNIDYNKHFLVHRQLFLMIATRNS